MSDSTSHSYNGLPRHQSSIAPCTSSEETSAGPTTLFVVVSPKTPTMDGGMPAASFGASTSATMEDVKLPWEGVDAIVMTSDRRNVSKIFSFASKKSDSTTSPSWMMPCGVVDKPNEATLSSEEDDEDDMPKDAVDFAVGITRKWLRSEEKEKEARNKRKAQEHAEEDKKRRATEGYRPAFIIDIDGVPLEEVETERRLVADVAARCLSQWKHDTKNTEK
jgi:hypothetical protein